MTIPCKGIVMFIHSRQDKTQQAVLEAVLEMWMERDLHFLAWRPRTPSPPPPFVVGVTCTFPILETVTKSLCGTRTPSLNARSATHVYIAIIPSFCRHICICLLLLLGHCHCFCLVLCLSLLFCPPLLSFTF